MWWGEGRVCPVQAGGVTSMVCPPLRWCCVCRGHAQYLVFALGTSKVAVGFFGLFVSLGSRICSNCSCTVSLYLVVGGEVCPSANTAVKVQGLRPSHLGSVLEPMQGRWGWRHGALLFLFSAFLPPPKPSPKAPHARQHGLGHREGRI